MQETWCANGRNHRDGKQKWGVFPSGVCAECEQGTKQRFVLRLIEDIRADVKDFVQVERRFWSRNRKRLLEIDDLGGPTILTDKSEQPIYVDDLDFLIKEFPSFSPDWIRRQRASGRMERILGVETYSHNALMPLFQFRINIPLGRGKMGSEENPEGVEKCKKAFELAKDISGLTVPSGKHIELAIKQMNVQGEAKPRERRSTQQIAERKANRKCKNELESHLRSLQQELERKDRELQEAKEKIMELQHKLLYYHSWTS